MKTALIVDDEPLVRRELREVLERAGYAVAEACSGREALQVLSDVKPAVLITDIFMPDSDGIELIRTVKSCHINVRIVAMSSGGYFGFPNYPALATKLGADLAYDKPLDLKRFLDDLNRLTSSETATAEPAVRV